MLCMYVCTLSSISRQFVDQKVTKDDMIFMGAGGNQHQPARTALDILPHPNVQWHTSL